ncbi:MAG: hypothetical protein ABEK01_03625 [Candidatus Nanohaloarchaea archaeon]
MKMLKRRKGLDISLSVIVSIMVGIIVAVTLAYIFTTRGNFLESFALKNLGIEVSLGNIVS